MKVSPSVLLACLATLCVPAVLALPATPDGAPNVAGVTDAADGLPPVTAAAPDLSQATLPALPPPSLPDGIGLDAAASVEAAVGDGPMQVGAHVGPAAPPDPAPSLRPASSGVTFAQKAAGVAQEAAGAGLLTVLLVGSSSGLDGLRALLARPGGRLEQAGRLALRALPLLPLFSRIEGAKVLDNPVRARVHQAVVQDPGLSLEEVRSRAGIAWGTAVHHLRRLEDSGLLVSVTQSARRRYFAANTPASRCRGGVAALAHPTARRVADLVRQRPGIGQGALCEALGLRNPAASKHLQQLAGQGLVLPQRMGRHCLYHPTAALHSAFAVVETTPTTVLAPYASTLPAAAPAMPATA